MLEIVIPEQHYEPFDENKNEFLPDIDIKETKIQLEHSLISLRKWEQKHHKPFLQETDKTKEEICDYIRCMTLTHGVDPEVYNWIPNDIVNEIVDYIKDPMTATWFSETGLGSGQNNSREVVTAEIIYYWMVTLSIPFECEKWHLNQLLTLIRVINVKNAKPKKVDKRVAARERAAINKRRREKYRSKG